MYISSPRYYFKAVVIICHISVAADCEDSVTKCPFDVIDFSAAVTADSAFKVHIVVYIAVTAYSATMFGITELSLSGCHCSFRIVMLMRLAEYNRVAVPCLIFGIVVFAVFPTFASIRRENDKFICTVIERRY